MESSTPSFTNLYQKKSKWCQVINTLSALKYEMLSINICTDIKNYELLLNILKQKRKLTKYTLESCCVDIESILVHLTFYGHQWETYDLVMHHASVTRKYRAKVLSWMSNSILCASCSLEIIYDSSTLIVDMALLVENINDELFDCMEQTFFTCFLVSHYGLQTIGNNWKAPLGFLMIFGNKYISHLLRHNTEDQLQQKLRFESVNNDGIQRNFKKFQLIKMSKKLKSWRFNVESYARNHLIQTFLKRTDFEFLVSGPGINSFVRAKLALRDKQYIKAKTYFIETICSGHSLYIVSKSSLYLSELCYSFSEYQIGLRCLKAAYKICYVHDGKHISPSFVLKGYVKKKELIKKQMQKMVCFNCKLRTKLRSCSGCMKVMYCSKRCQKIHWKCIHCETCDKSWSNTFIVIKQNLFDVLTHSLSF
eukprot:270767_1